MSQFVPSEPADESSSDSPHFQRRGVFISWVNKTGRSRGLARALGIPSEQNGGGDGFLLFRYLRLWRWTRAVIRSTKPEYVIVMQPPVIAMLAVVAHHRGPVIGDLHTGAFDDPKWRWALPLLLGMLRRRGFAIVTGPVLAAEVERRGTDAIVSHDVLEPVATVPLTTIEQSDYVLVPLAYAYDEPIAALLEAARLTPNIRYIWTGKAPYNVRDVAPPNVSFTGFVTDSRYLELLRGARVLLAITSMENTMQRVGYEAMSYGIPLVYSSTAVMREYFKAAGTATAPTPEEMAAALEKTWDDCRNCAEIIRARRHEILAEQRSVIADIGSRIDRLFTDGGVGVG